MRWLAAMMVALGMQSQSAQARTLDVEVAFQHIGGMLEPAEFDAWLASPDLVIEAVYQPLRLIEGKTARRIKTMPMGSRLEPNLHTITLRGAQIERAGRTLRFRLDEQPPTQELYRLFSVDLSVPIAPGIGRPQPTLRIGLLVIPRRAAHTRPRCLATSMRSIWERGCAIAGAMRLQAGNAASRYAEATRANWILNGIAFVRGTATWVSSTH